MRLSLKKQQTVWGYIFIGPWLIGAAVLFVWPMGRTLLLSFQEVTDLAFLQTEWVGLVNFSDILFKDVGFIPALITTMKEVVINVPLILVFSLLMAVFLAQVTRGQTFLRAVFFLPVVIGSAGVIQQLLEYGAGDELAAVTLGPLLQSMGEGDQGGTIVAPIQVVVNRLTVIIWHTGVEILLFVAGLKSIPPSLYEAAQVDGATGWESFWKISLPLLSPVILVAAIFALVDLFTDPLNNVVQYIMDVGIRRQGRLESAAALGVLYFVVVFVVLLLVTRFASKLVFYAGERQ
jgi:ABC-type sugar transport system permease subunit